MNFHCFPYELAFYEMHAILYHHC